MLPIKARDKQRLKQKALRCWACVVPVLLLAGTVTGMTASLHTVRVTDSWGESSTLVTWQKDPTVLMALTGFKLMEGDRYYFADHGNSTMSVNIQRAYPVSVLVDGAEKEVRVCGGTVEEVLAESGVVLGPHDYTQPSLNTQVDQNTSVAVHRVEYRDTVTTEPVPYQTEYVYSSLFHRFKSRTLTVQEGKDGIKEITHRERVVDGEVESSQVVKVEETLAPTNHIIKAFKERAPVSPLTGPEVVNGAPVTYSAVYTGKATGYSAKAGRGASRLGLHYGTVAVNPNLIPYGSKLYIESTDGKFVYGYAIATDTGIALMDGRVLVDLFYETYEESVMNGAKQVNVYVVG